MSDGHQLIAALAQERHRARYGDGGARDKPAGRRHMATVRVRAGWLLIGIGLRLAVADRGACKTARFSR